MSSTQLCTMGTLYEGSAVTSTVASGANRLLRRVVVPAGLYVITGGAGYESIFSGYNVQVMLTTGCGTTVTDVGTAVAGTVSRGLNKDYGNQNFCIVKHFSSETALGLVVYQDSGSSRTASAVSLLAMKID